jgi:4-amino-4-deoxy-L-arabinose transferase-like glycosyltransferase
MRSEELTADLRKTDKWSWIILAIALGIRVLYVSIAPEVDPFLRNDPLHGDAGSYDRIARNLISGKGYIEWGSTPTSFWPPLYPLFLAGTYSLLGHNIDTPRYIQTFFGALTCVALYHLVKALFGRRSALLAGVGMALHPLHIFFGAWLIAETLFLFLYVLTLAIAVHATRRTSLKTLALLGIMLGLDILAKPAAILLVPFLLAWVFLSISTLSIETRILYTLITALFAVAMISPWTIRNYMVHHDFVLVSTNGGLTFYAANNPEGFGGHVESAPPPLTGVSEPEAERQYYRLAIEWIRSSPWDFLRLLPKKLLRLWSPLSVATWEAEYPLPYPLGQAVKAIYGIFLLAAFCGIVVSREQEGEVAILLLPILQVVVAALVWYGDTRYSLPMQPSLVAFAAVAVTKCAEKLRCKYSAVVLQRIDAPKRRL